MSAGGRGVFIGFGLAVAAAIAAVAWLVLSGGPPRSIPVDTRGPLPPPPVKPKDPPPLEGPPIRGPVKRPPRPDRKPAEGPLEITGSVLDGTGAPVPGATVSLLRHFDEEPEAAPPVAPPASSLVSAELLGDLFALDPEEVARAAPYTGIPALPGGAGSRGEEARGTTGADGTFSIRAPYRNVFRVQAVKEGVGRASTDKARPGDPPIVLRLGGGTALEGRVVRQAGSVPVEGAHVVLRSGSTEMGVVSGPGGLFRAEGLPPGKYTLTAGAAGLAPGTLSGVEVPAGSGPVEIALGDGFAIRVVVMKWEDPPPGWRRGPGNNLPPGPPLEGARVVLHRAITDTYLTGLTGPDGVVRFERVGDGIWRVGAWKEGFSTGSGGRDLRLKEGSPPEETREVRLSASMPIPVRVLDEGGAPMAGARVYFGGRDEEFDEKHSRVVGRTDADGRIPVIFDDNVPAKSVVWIVPEGGGAAVMLEPDDFTSDAELKVVIPPGRVVQGRVTDGKGRPLKGADMTLTVYDDQSDLDLTLHVYTDADGRYRFPAVPFGEADLDVEWEDEWDSLSFEEENRANPLVQDFQFEEE